MDSAACSRSRVRQRPNGTPASAANARASVRSLAPTAWPHSSQRAPVRGVGPERLGHPPGGRRGRQPDLIVVTGTGVSRSASRTSACAR